CIIDVNISAAIDRHIRRKIQSREPGGTLVACKSGLASACDGVNDSIGRYLANPMISDIGDVKISHGIVGHTLWAVQGGRSRWPLIARITASGSLVETTPGAQTLDIVSRDDSKPTVGFQPKNQMIVGIGEYRLAAGVDGNS